MDNAQSAKIKELAQTLKKNGLAGSDSEAMRMAETMTTTEDKVNKNFEEKKSTMVRNYDFDKAKKNGATTYGDNPSTGIKSQIENAASAIGDPRTTEAATKPESLAEPQVQQESVQPWEKEEATREAKSAPVSPSFNGPNGAINNAISNVQERFAQQSAQQVNSELPAGLTLGEATNREQEAERKAPEAPVQEPVVQAPVEEAPVAAPVVEEVTEPQAYVEPQVEEAPVEQAPVEEAPVQEELPVAAPVQEAPVAAPVEQAPVQEQAPPVVEQSLPRPVVQEAPVQEELPVAAPVQEQAPPVQEPEAVAETKEEEDIVEKTQELPANPDPQKDTSKYAEAKIDLADVFNVNSNKRM